MSRVDWQETYKQSAPKLLGICRRYVKELAVAEDIVQDSFIVAMQKEDSLKNPKALEGWLCRIVVNMALHHIKNQKKLVFSSSEEHEFIDKSSLMSNLKMDDKSRLLALGFGVNDVLEAMDALPEHHRAVFNMYIMDQFSHKEIAEMLDISVGTSKSHLSRGRKSVQKYLLDKSKGQPVDEKKKRRVAIWLLLGFGNTMFAQNCRSLFKDYEIRIQKPEFNQTKSINSPTQFVGLYKSNKAIYISSLGIGVLILSLSLWFGFSTEKDENKLSSKEIEIALIKEKELVGQKTVSIVDLLEEKKELVVPDSIVTQIKDKENLGKPVLKMDSEIAVILNKKKTKDSVPTKSTKVIVVKRQVVKRDTIYVSK